MEIKAIEGLISLAIAAAFVYGPWQWVCTDWARQKLFIKRNALFDLARAGHIDFSSDGYRLVRSHIESMIRFSHDLTWIRVVLLYAGMKKLGMPFSNKEKAAISSIVDQELRSKVQALYDESAREIMLMVVLKSPVLILVLAVLFSGLVCARIISRLSKVGDAIFVRTKSRVNRQIGRIGNLINMEADSLRI